MSKLADFDVILNAAEEQVERRMRIDEQNSQDLMNILSSAASKDNSNPDIKLFLEDDILKTSQYIAMPTAFSSLISQQCTHMEMGLFPEINRVWVIRDNRLWLWDYLSTQQDELKRFEECPGFGQDLIISVALVVPKPTMFQEDIKYLLAIATDIEIILVALQFDLHFKTITPIRTDSKMSLDDIICKKIVSSQYGRIFVGGHDGSLFEIAYDHVNPWSALIGLGKADTQRTKCLKRKHALWDWSLARVVPSFLSNLHERMEDMAIDNVRNLLYTVTYANTSLWGPTLQLNALFLGPTRKPSLMSNFIGEYVTQSPFNIMAPSFDLFQQAREFCSNNKSSLKTFGDASMRRGPFSQDTLAELAATQKVVAGMHIVSMTESSKVHLIVVLANGFRIYLRLVSIEAGSQSKSFLEIDATSASKPLPDTDRANLSVGGRNSLEGAPPPKRLEVVYVRPPPKKNDLPSQKAWDTLSIKNGKEVLGGNVNAQAGGAHIVVTNSHYARGVCLMSIRAGQGDDLLGLSADLKDRRMNPTVEPVPETQPLSMREALCQPSLPAVGTETIMDIKESSLALEFTKGPALPQLLALYCTSYTPSSSAYRAPQLRMALPVPLEDQISETPMLPSQFLAGLGLPLGAGTQRNALSQIVQLSEFAMQHVPAPACSLQRQFLVLGKNGIHVILKRRPVEYLYDHLSRNENVRAIFSQSKELYDAFGAVEFCVMCLGIACGLPADVGDNALMTADAHQTPPYISQQIRFRAVHTMIQVVDACDTSSTSGQSQQVPAVGQNLSTPPSNPVITGLSVLAGRLLRPVWFRMIATDYRESESRPLATLWSLELITSILNPLVCLLDVIAKTYPTSITTDPTIILPALVAPVGLPVMSMPGQVGMQKPPEDVHREEKLAISKLYRLLKRATQALQLLRLLLVAERVWKWSDWLVKDPKGGDISWSRWTWSQECFRGVTFRVFVTDETLHGKTSAFLTALISSMSRRREAADKVALFTSTLDEECYMYYGLGDRKTNKAKEELSELQNLTSSSLSTTSAAIQARVQRAVSMTNEAARYWRTKQRIDKRENTVMLGRGDSDLETCCEALLAHGDETALDGIVDVCLTAADNFTNHSFSIPASGQGQFFRATSDSNGYVAGGESDRGLYHGSVIHDASEREECCNICYDVLVKFICRSGKRSVSHSSSIARGRSDDLMGRMVSRAVQRAGSDPRFQHKLCQALLDGPDRNEKQFLDLRSSFVDEYLRSSNRPDKWTKLCQWYSYHGQHQRAGEVLYEQAIISHSDPQFNGSMPRPTLETRKFYLKQAVASAQTVISTMTYAGAANNAALLTCTNYCECLQLAEIQSDSLQVLSALTDKTDPVIAQLLDRLENCFLTKGDWSNQAMFSVVCKTAENCFQQEAKSHLAYQVWGIVLRLLKALGATNAADVQQVWLKIIYR